MNTNENPLSVWRNFAEKSADTPIISVVVPCYRVAEFLPEFFKSVNSQTIRWSELEFIFVIDGSPAGEAEIIREWAVTTAHRITVIEQENTGVAGARNTGFAYARGSYINTSDPDDTFAADYFAKIAETVTVFPEHDLYVSRFVQFDAHGDIRSHPLDYRFRNTTDPQIVNLNVDTDFIHMHGCVMTFKREFLNAHGLRYTENLRQLAEDANFFARCLLARAEPEYVLMPQALYFYNPRANSLSGQVQTDMWRLANVIEHSHKPLLAQAAGECPQWLGNIILYDLFWLFFEHTTLRSNIFGIGSEQLDYFQSEIPKILRQVGLETIRAFDILMPHMDIRSAWEAAIDPHEVTEAAVAAEFDSLRSLQRIVVTCGSESHGYEFTYRGKPAKTKYKNERRILFFGETWAYEHTYWVAIPDAEPEIAELRMARAVSEEPLFADGQVFRIKELQSYLQLEHRILQDVKLARLVGSKGHFSRQIKRRRDYWVERAKGGLKRRFARLVGWNRKFKNAWILMDRPGTANDNAQHLYKYLAAARPDINAWFVLRKESEDWKRLKAKGFKLVAYGSAKHLALLDYAQVFASSHFNEEIINPFPKIYVGKNWHFAFLQHGVIHSRLDRWLNTRDADLFVTSTVAERNSIISKESPYKFSEREVVLTGQPRHDRLTKLLGERAGAPKKYIVVAPTWRQYLKDSHLQGSTAEQLPEIDYLKKWYKLVESEWLQELATRHNLTIVFLPHHEFRKLWNYRRLEKVAEVISFAENDVQQYLVDTKLFITDFSSLAFEAAYCEVPTAYFQFDRGDFYGGRHMAVAGYFRFTRDGFGPVSKSHSKMRQNVTQMLEGTHPKQSRYRQRIKELYVYRDGRASERIVIEIMKRISPSQSE